MICAARFALRLNAGADENQLAWTPLIRAVALGSLADVKRAVENGAALEDRDWWDRTAWLVAVQTGVIDKTEFIRDLGADVHACGRCGQPPLFSAIDSRHSPMLRWLIKLGADIEQTDQFGSLGYHGTRQYGVTPVYRLNTHSFRIDRVETRGDAAGWIFEHRAILLDGGKIRVLGGRIATLVENDEVHLTNDKSYLLDTQRLSWRLEVTE